MTEQTATALLDMMVANDLINELARSHLEAGDNLEVDLEYLTKLVSAAKGVALAQSDLSKRLRCSATANFGSVPAKLMLEAASEIERLSAVAQGGMQAAAEYIDAKADKYLQDYADTEHDTGATVFHRGEAGRDYHSSLVELANELRAQAAPSINRMVDKFLSWKLPEDFYPDAGISFKAPQHPSSWPTGSNLFDAVQARKMFEYVLTHEHHPRRWGIIPPHD